MVKTYFLVEIESEYKVAADTLAQNIQSRFPTSVESVKVEDIEKPPLALDAKLVCPLCGGSGRYKPGYGVRVEQPVSRP